MQIRIEDEVEDVISKSMSGQGVSDGELAESSGVDRAVIRALRKGEFDAEAASAIAPHLGLSAPALIELAEHAWYPDPIEVDGLETFNTPFPVPGYEEMTVNAYLVADPASGQAAAFDTGASADAMIETLQRKAWKLAAIFLTHTHRDHIADLDKLKALLVPGGAVYVHGNESLNGAKNFYDGQTFDLGALKITARETSGHSPGGTSYVIEGLARPLAIVGDAIFAGSIGGVRANYPGALKMIRERLLSLPGNAVLCPGHGPLTTVENEWAKNPYFASQS